VLPRSHRPRTDSGAKTCFPLKSWSATSVPCVGVCLGFIPYLFYTPVIRCAALSQKLNIKHKQAQNNCKKPGWGVTNQCCPLLCASCSHGSMTLTDTSSCCWKSNIIWIGVAVMAHST
jgi:hypothetical protein